MMSTEDAERPVGQLKEGNLASFVVPHMRRRRVLSVFALGILASATFRIDDSIPFLYYLAGSAGVMLLLSVLVIPRRWIIYPIMLLIIAMPDITQSAEQLEAAGLIRNATPWQFSIGPVTPAMLVFFPLALATLRLLRIPRHNPYNSLLFYYLVVTTVVSVWFGFPQQSLGRFAGDAKVALFFCVGLVLFASYYRRFPNTLVVTSQVFLALAAGHFLIDLIRLFVTSLQPLDWTGYVNLSLDSSKGLLTIFLFWSLSRVLDRRRMLGNLGLFALLLYLLAAYQTRWLVVTLILGIMMVTALIGFRRSVGMLLPAGLTLGLTLPLLVGFVPEVWDVMLLRFGFLSDLSTGSTLVDVEWARAGAIYNSVATLIDRGALLTGLGYGSWYSDIYFPMPNLTISAFDIASLDARQYYRVHDFLFHFLFKFGVIGVILYVGAFLRPLLRIWRIRRPVSLHPDLRRVAVVLYGVFPMAMTYMWFTGKGLLFCALFVVVCHEWARALEVSAALTSAAPQTSATG